MDVLVKNRKPQCEWLQLGVQGDNKVEVVRFIFPRYTSNRVDLYLGMAYVGFVLPDGSEHVVSITENYKKATEDTVILSWIVGNEATTQPGRISIAIKISGLEGELWKSEKAYCTVADTIPMESPQPIMFRSRSTNNVIPLLRTANPDTEPPITVSERTIIVPQELQNIAVQNDENSERVKIVCPRYFDGNDLEEYDFYLHTVSTGGENPDIYFTGDNKVVGQTEVSLFWTLKPPETSYAGKLSIQLKISGLGFRWATDSASVNIIRYLEGDPVIPLTPSFADKFLNEISIIRDSVKTSETAAKTSETNAAQSAIDSANSAAESKSSADNAALSATNAKTSENNANASVLAAKASEDNAASSVELAKNEADRSKSEADRAKQEADRAANIVGGNFANKVKNPTTGNIVTLTATGDIADSGKGLNDVGKVKSVFGREGEIVAQAGDYTAAQISIVAISGMEAATVQKAVNVLKRDADGVREYFTPQGEAKSAAALNGIPGKPVAPYVHTKTGTVHNLTGPSGAALIYFTATDVYHDGDTWTLNGAAVTVTYHDGQALLPTAVIAGDAVEAVVQGDTVRLLLQKPTPQPNLLINGLFDAKHLVNQRRQSEYTANAYTADMWFLWNPGKAALTDNGIVLSGGAGESTFYQLLPTLSQDELITITAKIDGKIYTASGKTGLGIFQLTPNGDIRSYFHGGHNMVLAQICISEGKSVLATSFKVEPGPRFTGWHEPKPGETLAECQRYYRHYDGGRIRFYNYKSSADYAYNMMNIVFDKPMRCRPAGTINYRINDGAVQTAQLYTDMCGPQKITMGESIPASSYIDVASYDVSADL